MTIPEVLQAALSAHTSGRLSEAEQLYRQVLVVDPQQPDAVHLLGVIAQQTDHLPEAIELIGRAVQLKPDAPEFHNNLGVALQRSERFEEALKEYQQAIALRPDYPEAQASLAATYKKLERYPEALETYRKVVQLRPHSAKDHVNLADLLMKMDDLDEAITVLRRAIELDPSLPESYNNLGNALRYKREIDEAIAVYKKAIELRPTFPEAYNNLGSAYRLKKEYPLAIENFRQSILLRPDYFKPVYSMAGTFFQLGLLEPALAGYRRALELHPEDIAIYINIGNVMKDEARLDEMLEWYDKALAADPKEIRAHSNRVYVLNFHPDYDAPKILAELRKWNDMHAKALMPAEPRYANDRSPDRRLRIGYVSPDFREHVVGHNVLPIIRDHDRSKFEIFCYSNVRAPDEMTKKFEGLADQWRPIYRVPDEAVAEKIREDQIDILVDLALHMSYGRLLVFARRPAPVQVTFAGYPGGTGLDAIDYRLSDPYLDPPDAAETYQVERCVRLPETFWCYDPEGMETDKAPELTPPPAEAKGYVTFGCLNNFCKINNGVLDLWGRVLTAVANSRLIILCQHGPQRKWVLGRLGERGIGAERVEFVERTARKPYLAFYNRIDVGLDTFPYNGHTTSLDSLWMGVPVVTLIGQTPVGRAGLSQLCNLGLGELAASTQEEFISIAAGLANDLPKLAELRRGLRQRMLRSPLCDAVKFTRNIEAAYRQMWREWVSR